MNSLATLFGPECVKVALQFSFSNRDLIPVECKGFNGQEPEGRKDVAAVMVGKQVVSTPKDRQWVDISDIFLDLEELGFIPSRINLEERVNRNNKVGNQFQEKYWMVRIQMSRQGQNGADLAVEKRRPFANAISRIVDLGDSHFWRVRAFKNPCARDGEVATDLHKVSICFEVPQPRYERDGNTGEQVLIQRYPNGQMGKYAGEKKSPLKPHFYLTAPGEELILEPAV